MKTAYYNGKVYTGEGFAQAFITEGGLFGAVGSNEEILSQMVDEMVDLKGHFVCAGFNDSHMHLLNYGHFLQIAHLNEHTSSLLCLLKYIKEFRQEKGLKGDQWLQGRGWNQDYFTDVKRMITRDDIDSVIDDIPVILTRTCGHCCVVNSRALELAGIDDNTVSPEGGAIGKGNGRLNGLFYDNAIDLIVKRIPIPDRQEIKGMILAGCNKLNGYGITSVQSDDYGVFSEIPYEVINEVYRQLADEGLLTVRVNQQANFTDLNRYMESVKNGNITGKGDGLYRIGPLKLLGDGSLGGRTAWLSRPYEDDPSTCGFPLFSDEFMNDIIDYANSHDMQVAVHAIGDRCLDQVLDAMEGALNKHPRKDHRHGIVHCQISRPDQLERIAGLNLHVYAQSIFLDYDNHIVYARAGKDLGDTSYSWKTLMDQGARVSNGSDAPVELPDVMKGIECAVTRTSLDGTGPYLEKEAFSVKEAIDSFTINGAYASFEEDMKGKIKKGQYADFTVLKQNPFETEKKKIHEIEVLETWTGGKQVYKRGESV